MVELVMLVGIPGVGKTSYARANFGSTHKIHSSDDLRKELFGDELVQDKNSELFEELHRRILSDLKSGISCVYDATNMNRKKRMSFLKRLSGVSCRKKCIILVEPPEICKGRNADRERKVPDEVIERMICRFECPYYYEGWDEIELYGDEIMEPVNWRELEDFDQCNTNHKFTLGQHLVKAWFYSMQQDFSRTVLIAALYHDIGKLYTRSFIDKKGGLSDNAHYYDHHNYGAYMYLCHNSPYTFVEKPRLEFVLYVANLINWHMRPFMAWNKSKKALERDRELIGDEMYQDILNLHEADLAAH